MATVTTNASAPKTRGKSNKLDLTTGAGQDAFILNALKASKKGNPEIVITEKFAGAAITPKPSKRQPATKSQGKAKPVATKSKEAKLCLTGSGQPCKKEFAGLGSDARYKSRLINIATGKEPADLPTIEQLKKLGYAEDRIKLVPHKGMSQIKATEIIATRGWSSHLIKRQDKLNGKTVGQGAKKLEKNARK